MHLNCYGGFFLISVWRIDNLSSVYPPHRNRKGAPQQILDGSCINLSFVWIYFVNHFCYYHYFCHYHFYHSFVKKKTLKIIGIADHRTFASRESSFSLWRQMTIAPLNMISILNNNIYGIRRVMFQCTECYCVFLLLSLI